MATLGDPLTDLALLLLYRRLGRLIGAAAISDAAAAPGFPPATSSSQRYAARTGRDLVATSASTSALACFKLAVILEGIHYRSRARPDRRRGLRRGSATAVVPAGSTRRAGPRTEGAGLMDFALRRTTEELREPTCSTSWTTHVYPAEPVFHGSSRSSTTRGPGTAPVLERAAGRGAPARAVEPVPARASTAPG